MQQFIITGDKNIVNSFQDQEILVLSQSSLPNTQSIQSTTEGILALSTSLSNTVRKELVLPQLKSSSLISLGQLCDDGYKVDLDKKALKVLKTTK